MDEADEKLRKTLFQKYAEDGDHFGDEWFDKFIDIDQTRTFVYSCDVQTI